MNSTDKVLIEALLYLIQEGRCPREWGMELERRGWVNIYQVRIALTRLGHREALVYLREHNRSAG